MKPYAPIPSTNPDSGVLKGVVLLQLLFALVGLVVERGNWPSVSMTIVSSLLILFGVREKINDERVDYLKLKACKTGLLFGTLLMMLVYLVGVMFRFNQPQPAQGHLVDATMPLSAFDALMVVMLITLGCYYYWRWQDGRAGPSD